ncbi:MAG: hypothetical protein KKA73_00180 [Chloroflexi bacterium]|nr:hypothetical protein [Chloroflexota bacterium]MBU1746079.1 hypothetical protein [Chloroflexota bacterium]
MLSLNGRSYRRPLADISDAELAHIGRTVFPKGLPLHAKFNAEGPSYINEELVPAVVNILDAARYDLDGDGQAENIYALHIPRFVPDPQHTDYPYFWDGPMSLAILSADNSTLLWQSSKDLNYVGVSGAMLHRPCTFIAPYQIAPDIPGLLFYRWVQIDGSGGGGEDWVTIYAWQNGTVSQVWEDRGSKGNSVGGGYNHYETSYIHLLDADADGIPEVLKTTTIQTSQGGGVPTVYDFHFRLRLPGSLAYKWTGQGYTACTLRPHDDTAELWPLRCGTTPFYASLISSTITLDGDLSDFAQLQYHNENASTPCVYHFQWRGTLNALWDSDTLYLGLNAREEAHSLKLWFDTDLAGDFARPTPNQDEVFIDITLLPGDDSAPQVTVMRPDAAGEWQPDPAATARVRAVGRLELAIPLDLLGLQDALQGVRFGTVEYETGFSSTIPFAVYRPRAIRAIGFAAELDYIDGYTGWEQPNKPLLDFDPTTWDNLVFMAEN